MRLTKAQLEEYEERGFVVFPDLFTQEEVELARGDISRLGEIDTDHVVREKSGAVRTVFRVHDEESPVYSAPYYAMARVPRVMDPVVDVLGDDQLYMHHSKLNLKDAIDGAIWQWHQDYGYWAFDGIPTPNMTTVLVMLGEATEMSGCLYFIPGSHKLGRLEPELDDKTTSYKLWTVPKDKIISVMEEYGDPVPIVGKPGTSVIFHPNLIHGSGHNMSRYPRWHMYFVYNSIQNMPRDVEDPRPEYVCSRAGKVLETVDDSAITASGGNRRSHIA